MQPFTEVFLSEIIGKPVIDKIGNHVGVVQDLAVTRQQAYPPVCAVLVQRQGQISAVRTAQVGVLNRQIVSLTEVRDRLQPAALTGQELLLRRNLLDKQIVDINGAKVVRINDLKIVQVDEHYRLVAADIGLRGLARRLGVERWLQKVLRWLHLALPDKLVSWDYVEPVDADLSAVKLSVPYKRLAALHPYDLAQIVSELSAQQRTAIFHSLDDKTAAETLAEMETDVQAAIIANMNKDRAADILEKMPSDDAADVLNELNEDQAQELLGLMESTEAADVRELREYDDDEAGSLMTTEFIALPEHLTAQETIDKLRELAPGAETIYYVYIVDAAGKLTGVISLRELIIAAPQAKLRDFMHTKIYSARDDGSVAEAVSLISKYNLLALPVVDADGAMQGIITVDDAIDAVLPRRPRLLRLYR